MKGARTPSSALSCQSQNEEQTKNKERVLHELASSTLQAILKKLLPPYVFQIVELRHSYETFDLSSVSLNLKSFALLQDLISEARSWVEILFENAHFQ